jgi:hypothetical protein
VGFSRLIASIAPVIKPQQEIVTPTVTDNTRKLVALIQKAQSHDNKLSEVVAETLAFALEISDAELTNWCSQELSGYPDGEEDDLPTYRYTNVFASFGLINQQYIGWGGNAANALNYMERDPKNFIPQKLGLLTRFHLLRTDCFDSQIRRSCMLLCRTKAVFLRAEKDPMSIYMEAAIRCVCF